jgi:hypothetical protein
MSTYKVPEQYTLIYRWNRFAEKCIPELAKDSVQYKEMKKTFYSGAMEGIAALMEITHDYSEKEAEWMMIDNIKEFQEFFNKKVTDQLLTNRQP